MLIAVGDEDPPEVAVELPPQALNKNSKSMSSG